MKNSRITKREINTTLKNGNVTEIHKLAAKLGIDANSKVAVCKFIEENAKTKKVYNSAYRIAFNRADFKHFRTYGSKHFRAPILEAIGFAKRQKQSGAMLTNYAKILIEGDKNIYWAHSGYGHSDYNKGVAFENTEINRKKAAIINAFLQS